MSVFSLLDEVKASLRPDQEILGVRDNVIERINKELTRRDVKAVAVPGGSVAKGTYLPLDHDVDVFVTFSLDYANIEEELPDMLEVVLKPFAPQRLHGSRDYFQFSHQGYDFEVIPVIAIKKPSQARNVTDASPLHVHYFRMHGKGLEDEVRLTKQFCKAAGVYGAESYIRGFSGHVIDLLVLYYRSFYSLIKAATQWKAPVIIDTHNHHEDPVDAINEAKHSPLILIDPVQPERNAAAALSQKQFRVFIRTAKEFIANPSESFFVVQPFRKDITLERLSAHPGSCVWIEITTEDDKKDVAGARVRKAFERIVREVRQAGFSIVENGWNFSFKNVSVAWVCVAEQELPETVEQTGPPVSQTTDSKRFRDTHENVFERDNRLFATVSRKERTLIEVVERACKEVSLTQKVSVQPKPLSSEKATQE